LFLVTLIYDVLNKAPILPHPRDLIELPAVVEPHQGTSYNPPASAHQELLLKAHEIEEQRERDANKVARVKEAMELAWNQGETIQVGVAPGMVVDSVQSDAEDERPSSERAIGVVVKTTERKTKQQRRKAARLLAEVYYFFDLLN
jgi:nucleolar protein 53